MKTLKQIIAELPPEERVKVQDRARELLAAMDKPRLDAQNSGAKLQRAW